MDEIKTNFPGALTAIINGKKAKIAATMGDGHVEMKIEGDEKTLILVSRRNGSSHYRPSMKALFSDDWVVFD